MHVHVFGNFKEHNGKSNQRNVGGHSTEAIERWEKKRASELLMDVTGDYHSHSATWSCALAFYF